MENINNRNNMEMNSECNSESEPIMKPDLHLEKKKDHDKKDDNFVGTDQHHHCRKKKVDVPTGSISHVDNLVLTTKAVFTIYKQFENVSELKDKISTCMKKVSKSIGPELLDEEIVCSKEKGKCTLLFPKTVNKKKAEHFIMDLRRIVNTDLKTTVSFNLYSFVDKKSDVSNDINQKLNVNMIDKNVMSEAAQNTHLDQISNAKKDISKPLSGKSKASVMTSDVKVTSSIPTVIKLKIMERNLDKDAILELLSPIKELEKSLEKITVNSSNSASSQCTLVITSKSAALRIANQINTTKWKVSVKAFVEIQKQNKHNNGDGISVKKVDDLHAKGDFQKQDLPRTKTKKDVDKQKDLMHQTGSKCSDTKRTEDKRKINVSIIQCLKAELKINKYFEKDDLKRIIKRSHQHLNPSGTLNIENESIKQEDKKTSCTVVITSKGINPKTLLHKLCKEIETTIHKKVEIFLISKSVEKIFCERNDELEQETIRKVEKMKNCIQDMLRQIESKIQHNLINHNKKISEEVKKQEKLFRRVNKNNSSDLLAIEDKIKELRRQSVIFREWCSTMRNKLKEIDPSQVTKDELTALTQQVGVECQRLANALPMYARRKGIVDKVSSNQVSIILGETGSGKSTQLVQYLYEAGFAQNGQIVCTQPRKLAAITLAERVSKEMVTRVGGLVGYKTGVRKNVTDSTKIIFSTDHSLLNECLKNQNFSGYSCIIVDEAHERSIYTDLLLSMIKKCLPQRPDLKVIITSATIDPGIFIQYFQSGPELSVSGRMFPVDIIYDDSDAVVEFEDYERKAVAKVIEVHTYEGPGDILVFLTSPVEIMRCCEEFEKQMKRATNFKCFPLHGQLQPDEQKKVFDQLNSGIRKIVFATNCAETSITIDGIKFVIDAGVAKEVKYDAKKNISVLGTHVISKSSANQRKGRAGRTASGKCFRLYSEEGYNKMETVSKPEIMRSHLGQAVLKLAALGIDCTSYDFVESPGKDAIDAAMSSLFHLGAMSKDGITDLGKWINKLPFDPRQGFLIYHGLQENVLYDAVVIASLLTNGSNIFYRGLSETDQQKSSKSKTKFASQDGDVFTWLQVYKDWIKEPKKVQSKWCKDNSINYKIISYTKQAVEEMADILSKEANIKMVNAFSEDGQVINIFKKLIFQAYTSSLSHFLGNLKAGYYALKYEKQIHFHPSSSLLSLNAQPEWIVYTDLTETTRAFIKGISVVDEDWVVEALEQGRLTFSMEDVKERKIELVHREEIGMTMFRNLVGPKYSHLRELEEELSSSGMSTVVVEADRELGIIDVHSSSPMDANIVKELKQSKKITLQSLQLDEDEIAVIKNSNGADTIGFRVVLGEGGLVKSFLMPDESIKIIIKKSSFGITEEEIRTKFSVYGDILECIKFKKSNPWGFIRYGSKYEAKSAVKNTVNDKENVASLKTEIEFKKAQSKLEAKVSWCRRAIIGDGTAFIKCNALDKASFLGKKITLPHGPREIYLSREGEDLICFNTGKASEEEIENSVLALVNFDKRIARQLFVTVSRLRVPKWEDEMEEMKSLLTDELEKFATILKIPHNKFQIKLKTPKNASINYVGFIHFDNISEGEQLCNFVSNKLTIQGKPVDINSSLKTTLFVPTAIMNKIKEDFDEIVENLMSENNVEINIREMKLGDVAVDIRSVSAKSLVEARDLFQKLLDGEVIDCSLSDLTRKILKHEGKKMLTRIEEKLDILIVVDERKERIQLYGSQDLINDTKIKINEFMDQLYKAKKIDIELNGHGKPPGIMKKLMKKFGDLPDGFVKHFHLIDIEIDFKRQKLSILGPPEHVDETEQCIKDIEQNLATKDSLLFEKWMPDCLVCMCPIENHCELYRLEACGHSYCHSCLKTMIRVAVDDKKFPIECVKEDCQMPLVWKDLRFFLKEKCISGTKLVLSSLDALVAKNSSHYKYCKTANCPVVYEVTENVEGHEFNCPACLNSICTSCHANYHVGLSCKRFVTQQEADIMFERWKRADPKNRKACPNCKAPVEKNEGCNHMDCTACKIHFCWICLALFQDEQVCYKHLREKHGGIN